VSQAPPAFITHHEIETFLGGGKGAKRQRQRLQEDHRLPEPHWLARVDRFRTGIYPTFALAGLIDGVVQAPRALDRMQRLSAEVFSSVAFRELTVALDQSIAEVIHAQGPDGWRFDTVVQRLGDLAEPVVLEWDGLVGEAEDQLVQWGIRFSSEFGSVERRSADMYVIALAERKGPPGSAPSHAVYVKPRDEVLFGDIFEAPYLFDVHLQGDAARLTSAEFPPKAPLDGAFYAELSGKLSLSGDVVRAHGRSGA